MDNPGASPGGSAPPVPAGAGSREFIAALESIRGLAALAVALFHAFYFLPVAGMSVYTKTFQDTLPPDALLMRLLLIPFNGSAAVSLFFVLSGYVLGLSLNRDHHPFLPKAFLFTARRFLRIYPPLAVNLVLMMAAFAGLAAMGANVGFKVPSFADLRTNLLLTAFPVNGATWTLFIELAVIPFLLAGCLFRRRLGLGGTLLFLGLSLIPMLKPKLTGHMLLGSYLFMFILGTLVAELGGKGFAVRRRAPAVIGLAVSVAGLLSARYFFGYFTRTSLLWEGIGSAVLIAIIAHGPRLAVHRFLETPALRFLGRTSYSFYLYHPVALAAVVAVTAMVFPYSGMEARPFLWSAIFGVLSVAVAVPLGWASYRFVEMPMVRLGRKL